MIPPLSLDDAIEECSDGIDDRAQHGLESLSYVAVGVPGVIDDSADDGGNEHRPETTDRSVFCLCQGSKHRTLRSGSMLEVDAVPRAREKTWDRRARMP